MLLATLINVVVAVAVAVAVAVVAVVVVDDVEGGVAGPDALAATAALLVVLFVFTLLLLELSGVPSRDFDQSLS